MHPKNKGSATFQNKRCICILLTKVYKVYVFSCTSISVDVFLSCVILPRPKAFTSARLRFSAFSLWSIWIITYLPVASWPGICISIWLFHSCLTWDDDVLPISARSSKMPEEGATREHLAGRGRKLVRNADIDISSSLPTAVNSVEYLNPLNGDWSFVVNGKPGWRVLSALCVADGLDITINTFLCSFVIWCGWLAGTHRLELNSWKIIDVKR